MVASQSNDQNGQQLWTENPSVLLKHPTELLPDGGLSTSLLSLLNAVWKAPKPQKKSAKVTGILYC